MNYNELHMLFQAGVDADEITVFSLKDYGFGFPEDGLYCTAGTLRRRTGGGGRLPGGIAGRVAVCGRALPRRRWISSWSTWRRATSPPTGPI